MARTRIDGERPLHHAGVATEHQQFVITGLSCAAEAVGLERRLRRLAGVENVVVNPVTDLAYVTYDPERFEPAALVAAIEAAGYRAG